MNAKADHQSSNRSGRARQRRREHRSWCVYDWANSAYWTSVVTVFFSQYLTLVAKQDAQNNVALNGPAACPGGSSLERCDISAFGFSFPAGSLWGYLLALATVIQVLVLPITGAIADRTQHKKGMLALFAFGGATATALLALVSEGNWPLGVVFFICANICFGAGEAVYFSFLPEIAGPDERDKLSAQAWAFGYLGGGVALGLHLLLYQFHEAVGLSESAAVRVIFVLTGLWWAGFTVIPLLWLRQHRSAQGSERGVAVLTAGFRQLADTVRSARSFPLTLGFLGAYFVFADGINTVVSVSAQYGREELRLDQSSLIVTVLIVQFIAFFGGQLHALVAKYLGAKKTIMASLTAWVVVVSAAYFVEAGQPVQFYLLAVGIGLVLGGTNALARSLFSQLVPPGKEAEYFSLYLLGERATSWLGPLVFGGVAQATGSFRPAIVSLVIFFAVGLALTALVPVRKAVRAAGNPVPEVL